MIASMMASAIHLARAQPRYLKPIMFGTRPVGAQSEFLQLGGEPEAMDQAKDADCDPVVGLKAKYRLEAAEVVERLVGDREADHGVDQISVDLELSRTPDSNVMLCPMENSVT